MESLESRVNRLEYYIELLSESAVLQGRPFVELVIKRELTKEEASEIYRLCEELNKVYDEQKAEGFVDFTPLLTQFVGMLNHKLTPNETIQAIMKEGMYLPLMNEFVSIIERIRE
ncbi:DUF1878 family protein [Metabacillus iocasae]|uniref:DUF1878 domain-containing protein n=1 Tax=Priestia iocasae TaxID=2291674 RepID=A0ABS2QT97_9BACI|nr:DUF1878 family protein [Metabacillus iocasae]MBM7702685.1 hypothetical protein [Metabacillus iocasae]